jgi:CheY-like chemotaxis protein
VLRAPEPEPRPPEAPRADDPGILVIEDDPRDRQLLVDALTASGHSCITACDGSEALELCRSRSFDAITLDLLLPDLHGWEIVAAIRAGGPNRDTPVIVVTVVGSASAAFPVHDYLCKPLDPAALVKSLKRAVPSADARQRRVLVLDDSPANLHLAEIAIRQAGFKAVCRSDARTALLEVQADPPAAILLDLLMSPMDGFEFLARFRETPAGRSTPVIVWTAHELSLTERERLARASAAVVPKGLHSTDSLIRELQQLRPRPRTS